MGTLNNFRSERVDLYNATITVKEMIDRTIRKNNAAITMAMDNQYVGIVKDQCNAQTQWLVKEAMYYFTWSLFTRWLTLNRLYKECESQYKADAMALSSKNRRGLLYATR